MSLTSGTRLGPYEIAAALGAGGMGEVYRATDTNLKRSVAIKVLPAAVAGDADRLARFQREAEVLAALNHPNIAAIYGLEKTPDLTALVMELVEGDDLSARISRGALPLSDALPIARQIADALEAAHEHGIIHRDLKPANIKVRADGTVKVLDFGLAKAMGVPGSEDPGLHGAGSPSNSPTLTARATQMGMIIGTAAYMAPEQAKGRPVDKRADVWAFGVVLYEMLTGRRAFEGEDVSTTLAAVLMRDPDWAALPQDMPVPLQILIRRCMERDPKLRLRDIGEARVLLANPTALSGAPSTASPPAATPPRPRAPWMIAGAALVMALVFLVLWLSGGGPQTTSDRVEALLAPPPGTNIGAGFALSPDGRRLVVSAASLDTGVSSLWLRDLSSGTPQEIAQTEGGIMPFWSSDGTQVAFFADGKLKKSDLQGSPPQVICDAPSPRGGAWGPNGKIVFAGSFRTGLEIVDAAGGVPTTLTTLDEKRLEKSHRWPTFLPDGDHLLFVAQTGEAGAKEDASTIEALSVSTGTRTRLVTANSSPIYAAGGFLLFWREGALRAQAFDAKRLVVSGNVFPVATGVAFDSNEFAYASASADGRLVYLSGSVTSRSSLVLVDRTGRPVTTIAESLLMEGGLALSHDGTRLAVAITAEGARDTDIWIYDLKRGASGPLTFEAGGDRFPVWSRDDREVLYSNDHKNDGIVFRRSSDGRGQAEVTASNASGLWSYGWSRDGSWIVAGSVSGPTSFDLFRYDRKSEKFTPLVQTPFNDHTGALSPDDRWLAYSSDQTGRREVYVASLSGDSGRWQVSTQGGSVPLWSGNGRELYFLGSQNRLMVVDVEAAATFRHSAPRALFTALFNSDGAEEQERFYAPMPDGQRFVVDVLKERATTFLTLVTNWTAGAK